MKKRILSVCMTLCMILTLLPVAAFAAGSDSSADQFIGEFQQMDHSTWTAVSTVDDLKNISNNLGGKYYLTGDLDLSGVEWEPIGTQSSPFTGRLDGCGHVIRNLTITGRNGRNDFGLFGAVRNAQIFDLGLEKVGIKVDSDTQGSTTASNVGGLVGYAANTSGSATVIMNCYVTGDISFNSSGEYSGYVGGLVGRISMSRYSSYYGASLLVGTSYNRAKVTGSGYSCMVDAGGLIGYAGASDQNGRLGVQYSFNAGKVTAYAHNDSSSVGGLLGSNDGNASFYGCYNSGAVYATGGQGMGGYYRSSFEAGGLAGVNYGSLLLSQCYNCGDVEAVNTTSTNECDVVAGGLLGEGNYQTGVEYCYNSGDVSAEGSYGETRVGGLAGLINAVREDIYLSQGAYFTDSFVLSESVTVYGRADVSEAALVYTTNREDGKWVDNGFGNVWQEGTKDTVTKNTAVAADDITGNADDNAKGGKITRAEAEQLGTYTAKGWNEGDTFWKMVTDYPYPQLFFQTEVLGYTGGAVRGELGGSVAIDNLAPKLGDTLSVDTTGLTVTPDEAKLGTLSYQWMRDGGAISGATEATYQLTAEDVGHAIKVTVTASNCNGSVTSQPTASVGKGTYTGEAALTQTIRTGAAGSLTVDLSQLVPEAVNPVYTVAGTTDGDGILNGQPTIEGAAMTVPYNAVAEAGKTAQITLTIASDVYEDITATVTIQTVDKNDLPAGDILCDDVTVDYDGQPHAIGQASVTGEYTGGEFTFTYQYKSDTYDSAEAPTNAGAYTVTITAENADYLGTATATLTIQPKVLEDGMVSVAGATYNGKGQTPVLTVKDGETALVQDTDYTLDFAAQTDAGTYPVEITGKGNYTGTAKADFVIAPLDIKDAVVTLAQDGYVYTGSPIEPAVTSVTVGELALTADDYTVSYANNTELGTGTVTVTGQGNCTGTASKEFAIIESEYYFSLTAPQNMVVGQTADAAAALVGMETAAAYEHALIQVTVTGPEGAKPQVMATDTEGKEWNLAEVGQWGPDGGFPVQANYNVTTDLKLTFDQPGTYTAAFQLVDLDNDNAVLGSGTCTIAVADAYSFTITAPDSMRPNTTGDATAALKGDANAPAYEHALIKIQVEAPEGAAPKIMATDTEGKEWNLAEVGQWGPDGGFQVTAGYDVTTDLKLTFDKEGTYKVTFQLVDVDTGKVLGSGEKSISVYTPSSGGGGSATYAITVEDSDNGTVTASRKSASEGSTVTLTVKPDEGYALDTLTVTGKNGNEVKLTDKGDGKYTFSMPASAVTVKAAFTAEEVPAELPFADVKTGDWFYDAAKYVYDNELMDGTSATTFAPLMTTNRAMVVTILWRQAGSPVVNHAMNFDDVESGAWYTEAVRWAASENIVKGYSDTVFAPDDTVTREQLAAILYRYAESKGCDVSAKGDLTVFTDGGNTSSWAAEAMEWAVGAQLLSGKDGNVLDPTGTATRAEVAKILMSFCQSYTEE